MRLTKERLMDWMAARLGREATDRWVMRLHQAVDSVRGPQWERNPFMEAWPSAWNGVMSLTDEDGRILGETHGLPRGVQSHPSIEFELWTTPGSRMGLPFNSAAMKQAVAVFNRVLSDTDVLRSALRARWRRPVAEPLSYAELYELSRVSTGLPGFLVRRTDGPLRDGQLPATLAVLYKIPSGLHLGLDCFFSAKALENGFDPCQAVDRDGLYDFIEDRGLLISGKGSVCAAPRVMIQKYFSVAISGAKSGKPGCLRPDQPDLSRFLDYGHADVRRHFSLERANAAATWALRAWLLGEDERAPDEHQRAAQMLDELGGDVPPEAVLAETVRIASAALEHLQHRPDEGVNREAARWLDRGDGAGDGPRAFRDLRRHGRRELQELFDEASIALRRPARSLPREVFERVEVPRLPAAWASQEAFSDPRSEH